MISFISFMLINWTSEGALSISLSNAILPLPFRISYGVISFSCFTLACIRLALVNLTAGRCRCAPLDAPQFAKPRKVPGILYTLKYVLSHSKPNYLTHSSRRERAGIVFVRALLTVLIIAAFLSFAANAIISDPAQGSQSVKTYQSQDSFDWSAWETEWSISIVSRKPQPSSVTDSSGLLISDIQTITTRRYRPWICGERGRRQQFRSRILLQSKELPIGPHVRL